MIPRRNFLQGCGTLGLIALFEPSAPAYAWAGDSLGTTSKGRPTEIDLAINKFAFEVNGRIGSAIAMNGTVPGPLIRLREGEEAIIRVTNHLDEVTSIHWHGILVPPDMDGVPGVSFAGIQPGETFTYRFPVGQSGTYWCHSHSGGQELLGVYAPLIIDPARPEPFQFDRDYVVMLSDWSFESPMRIIEKLKKKANYYNYQQRTVMDLFHDSEKSGFSSALKDRLEWGNMNMDPTDIADVTGATYTYLMNGLTPALNWTAIFKPKERVRLRFIDAGAMTYFDVRIPGLKMKLIQADGQNIKPVEIEEFRIAPGETYDVIVEPREEEAYTIFAETMDRSGYARGTLAPRVGMSGAIPNRRTRPIRSMSDMGMNMSAMAMPATDSKPQDPSMAVMDMSGDKGREIPLSGTPSMDGMVGMPSPKSRGAKISGSDTVPHGPDDHGPGNSAVPMETRSRLHEPGTGLENNSHRVLVYADLQSLTQGQDMREPSREVEIHLTGNMERYMWSFDGKKYSEAKTPIPFRYGERLRLTLVNDTMMEHPIHLHGMWMELENGAGMYKPRKHTISIKPAERVSVAITADALGRWAFHCHLLLHMEQGMFRVVEVSQSSKDSV